MLYYSNMNTKLQYVIHSQILARKLSFWQRHFFLLFDIRGQIGNKSVYS